MFPYFRTIWYPTYATDRLGPLSIEAKKRNVGKRAKLEQNIKDQKKPQNITEDDIQRSEYETTKNVSRVSCDQSFICVHQLIWGKD